MTAHLTKLLNDYRDAVETYSEMQARQRSQSYHIERVTKTRIALVLEVERLEALASEATEWRNSVALFHSARKP